jgi:NAD-dependent deacetylase
MKITVFTGAGISQESGINTFRDKGGIWEKFDYEEVSSLNGWKKNRESVIDFYNLCWKELRNKVPNDAHSYLAKLEENHDVTILTQNVDNLHEKAGSTNVVHLHGNLNESRSSHSIDLIYPYDKDIKIGDKCEMGSQLRPNVVWFGESPTNESIQKSLEALENCELLLIIDTSLNIGYTLTLLESIDEDKVSVIYIDPNPSDFMDSIYPIDYIKEKASVGMKQIYEGLML